MAAAPAVAAGASLSSSSPQADTEIAMPQPITHQTNDLKLESRHRADFARGLGADFALRRGQGVKDVAIEVSVVSVVVNAAP